MSEEKKQSTGGSRAKNGGTQNAQSAKKKTEPKEEPRAQSETGKKKSESRTGGAKRTQQTSAAQEPRIEPPKPEPKVKKEPNPSSVGNQLAILLLAVLALFIGLCFAFRDDMGAIGYGINFAFYGLFGLGALLVPFLLVQMALFWRRDVASGAVKYKYAVAIFVLIFFSVIAHTIYYIAADIPKLTIAGVFSAENLKGLFEKGLEYRGGGFLGGVLASALICAVGYPGTIMFGLIFLAVFVMTLFGLTPSECMQRYRFYRQRSQSAQQKLRKEQEMRREAAQRQEQQKRDNTPPPSAKQKKPASAVRKKRSDDIDREIFADDAAFGASSDEKPAEPAPKQPAQGGASTVSAVAQDEDRDEAVLSRRASADARAVSDCDEERAPAYEDVSVGGSSYAPQAPFDFDEPEEEMPNFVPARRKRKEPMQTPSASPAQKPAQQIPAAPAQKPAQQIPAAPAQKPAQQTPAAPAQEPAQQTPVAPAQKPAQKPLMSVATEPCAAVPKEKKPVPAVVPSSPAPIPAASDAEPEKQVADAERRTDEISIRPPEMSVPAPSTTDEEGEDEEMIPRRREYEFPPIDLLQEKPIDEKQTDVSAELRENADRIIQTLDSFNVRVNISNVSRGPTITRYEVEPAAGTRVRSILNLLDDIALSLATSGLRSDGIITGKAAIGIEVPNKVTNTVFVRELIEDSRFESAKSKLTASLGMDVSGAPVYLDIAKMPHLLIAGATGQGKSVCINSLLISLLYKARPDEVKLILIDPKKVELNVYNGLPHLLVPVVFEPKKAAGSLHWAVQEMERRFELIEAQHVRNLAQYNAAVADDPNKEKLPQIVIIIDELADLMMSAPDDVETSICRLAQKARAAGMHLIIGTQRPSTDVITGLIKANIPSRIAFTVSNQIDSRIIIDTQGAEKLIGKGDMLFSPVGSSKPIRVQGSFVSETEIENIIDFIKEQSRDCSYSDEVIKEIEKAAATCGQKKKGGAQQSAPLDPNDIAEENDPMLDSAIELAVEEGKISTSLIQRRLSLGYGRAAKLIDVMEHKGIVSPPDGQRPRKVLISREQYLEMRMNHIDGDAATEGDDAPPFDV